MNPLQHCLTNEDTVGVVDEILGPFLLKRIGQNDMAIVTGLMASAAILIVTHCQRTGEDLSEFSGMMRDHFDLALKVASDDRRR
jgi:hypothetical protein